MSDNNLRTEFEQAVAEARQEEIFDPAFRKRKLILWAIRVAIGAILYIIFWEYEWVRWTLLVTVPLSLAFLSSLLFIPRLLERKMERTRRTIVESEALESTARFSDRVEAYVRYRPGYPDALIDELRKVVRLDRESTIVDIGSGTGISSELFLRHGMTVWGVEPNDAMREAAERELERYESFHSVDGTAEETTLPDGFADLIIAGQAFHWFDREKVKREWQRVLVPGGHILLFWNSRRTESSPFLIAYEEMLQKYGTDYREINHQNITDEEIAEFFAPATSHRITLENEQLFDFEGVRGRLESSSYTPAPGHPDYEPMIERLREIVGEHGEEGRVRMEYDLVAWMGQFSNGDSSL